jgi:hypothetical protein
MTCRSKKLQSWLEGLFIMPRSVMEPVVELLAVFSLSLSLCVHEHTPDINDFDII